MERKYQYGVVYNLRGVLNKGLPVLKFVGPANHCSPQLFEFFKWTGSCVGGVRCLLWRWCCWDGGYAPRKHVSWELVHGVLLVLLLRLLGLRVWNLRHPRKVCKERGLVLLHFFLSSFTHKHTRSLLFSSLYCCSMLFSFFFFLNS